MKNSKLILVSHRDAFTPICKALGSDGYSFLTLTPQFSGTLRDMDLKANPLTDIAPLVKDGAYQAAAQLLRADVTSSLSLDAGAQRWLDDNLLAFLYSRLPDLCTLVLALDKAGPALVLLHNDVEPINRATALWARARGVPCLHIPHAVYLNVNRGKAGGDVHDLVTASHLAVSGPFQREWYEARGAKPESIRETGLPHFDKWAMPFPVDRASARRLLSKPGGSVLPPDVPVACYCSTWPQHSNIRGISNEWQESYFAFLKAAKQIEGLAVIVKCHPNGGQANWDWHAQQAHNAKVPAVVTPLHLDICLRASDIAVVYGGSNTLLEASFVPGLRLATIRGYEDDPEVFKAGPTVESLYVTIIDALGRPAPKVGRFQAKYLGQADGRASERITAWCRELVG